MSRVYLELSRETSTQKLYAPIWPEGDHLCLMSEGACQFDYMFSLLRAKSRN